LTEHRAGSERSSWHWFFVKVGLASAKPGDPRRYDGDAFRAILDESLGR